MPWVTVCYIVGPPTPEVPGPGAAPPGQTPEDVEPPEPLQQRQARTHGHDHDKTVGMDQW